MVLSRIPSDKTPDQQPSKFITTKK